MDSKLVSPAGANSSRSG